MFNNLFNKKKYDVKPENNRAQRLYGVPNTDQQEAKYDIKPEENAPQKVYGVKSYNIDESRNTPRMVYGPPEVMMKLREEEEKKNGKEVFAAFQSEYAGPSHYYYVNSFQDTYQFRYGYTDNGANEENHVDNPNLTIVEQDEAYYKKFIEELLPIMKEWNYIYMNTNIPNGTEWNINCISEGQNYHGLNAFPENYDSAMDVINHYFQVENHEYTNKYDIDPHDNIPEDLYGIPDFLNYQDDEDQ